MAPSAELLPGKLDPVILEAHPLADVHGYGVPLRIVHISGRAILAIAQSLTATPQEP